MARHLWIASLLLLAACSEEAADPNRNASTDGRSDTGRFDSSEDAGDEPDTAVDDTGSDDTGSDDTGSDDTTTADTTPTDTGEQPDTAIDDTGEGDVGGDDTTAADTTPTDTGSITPVFGAVSVFESRSAFAADLNVGGLTASFATSEAAEATPVSTFGDCGVFAGGGTTPTVSSLDAGTVRVAIGAQSYTLSLSSTGGSATYQSSASSTQDEFFAGGESIQVTSDGGADVGAFSGEVAAPQDPTISSPSWSPPLGSAAPRSRDLVVSWAGSGGGQVVISLINVNLNPAGPTGGNVIACVVADTGSATIPSAALQRMDSTGFFSGTATALTVARINESEVINGAATVKLNASAAQTIVGSLQ
jgi:hypothetical protein